MAAEEGEGRHSRPGEAGDVREEIGAKRFRDLGSILNGNQNEIF